MPLTPKVDLYAAEGGEMRRMSARPSCLSWADSPPPLSGTTHTRLDRPGRHEPLCRRAGGAATEEPDEETSQHRNRYIGVFLTTS
jgi:hypothetical protein